MWSDKNLRPPPVFFFLFLFLLPISSSIIQNGILERILQKNEWLIHNFQKETKRKKKKKRNNSSIFSKKKKKKELESLSMYRKPLSPWGAAMEFISFLFVILLQFTFHLIISILQLVLSITHLNYSVEFIFPEL